MTNSHTSNASQKASSAATRCPIESVVGLALVCHDRLGQREGRAHGGFEGAADVLAYAVQMIQTTARTKEANSATRPGEEPHGAA